MEDIYPAECSLPSLVVADPNFFRDWRSQYSGVWLERFDLLAKSPETAISGVQTFCAIGGTTGRFLGVALAESSLMDSLQPLSRSWISYVWTPEKWRGSGIASKLIQQIWKDKRTDTVALCSARSNEDASRNLYARLGFHAFRPGSFMMLKGMYSARGGDMGESLWCHLKASDMGVVSILLQENFLEFVNGKWQLSTSADPEETFSLCISKGFSGGLLSVRTIANLTWLLWVISVDGDMQIRASAPGQRLCHSDLDSYGPLVFDRAMEVADIVSGRRHRYLPPRY